MSGQRRHGTALLATLGLLLFVGWLFYVPILPGGPLRAVPANALAMGRHLDLAERWQEVLGNPLAGSLLTSVGVEAAEVAAIMENPNVGGLVRQLAPHEVTWSYLPGEGPFGEPAWVFTSWLGGRSQVLRWLYGWAPPAGAVRAPLQTGGSYWTMPADGLPEGSILTVAFPEGMVVGVLSPDPRRILHVLDVFQGRAASVFDVGGEQPESGACGGSDALDRGWFKVGLSPADGLTPPSRVSYLLDRVDETGLSGRLCANEDLLGELEAAGEDSDRELAQLIGGARPMALGISSPDVLVELLQSTTDPVWSEALSALWGATPPGSIRLVVLGDPYTGRYMGIKVPTILGAARLGDSKEALQGMQRVMDKLNARYRWGLVPRAVPVGDATVYALEKTNENNILKLALNEAPACAVVGPWLVMTSNLTGLVRLVKDAGRASAGHAEAGLPWDGALEEEETIAYTWFELARSAKTLRAALKVYSLKLLVDDARASQETRQQLNVATAWANAIEHLGEAQLWLCGENHGRELAFEIGKSP